MSGLEAVFLYLTKASSRQQERTRAKSHLIIDSLVRKCSSPLIESIILSSLSTPRGLKVNRESHLSAAQRSMNLRFSTSQKPQSKRALSYTLTRSINGPQAARPLRARRARISNTSFFRTIVRGSQFLNQLYFRKLKTA